MTLWNVVEVSRGRDKLEKVARWAHYWGCITFQSLSPASLLRGHHEAHTRSVLAHGPANMTFCLAAGPEAVLTYIHLQLTHFTNNVALRSPQVLGPGYTLNNLSRGRRLQIWPLKQMGDLHRKELLCVVRIIFTVPVVLFQIVTDCGYLHIWWN